MSVVKKIVGVLVLLPIAVVAVALALVNRHPVTISLDPFAADDLTYSVQVPLFALALGLVAFGVLLGGMAAWFKQSKWRRLARRSEHNLEAARFEVKELERKLSSAQEQSRAVASRALQRPAA
jgi:uncharacterized integral membrane protein